MWGLEEIREYLKKNLKPSRYGHTLGVVNTAIKLAEVYGEDKNKAEIAAPVSYTHLDVYKRQYILRMKLKKT